MKRRMYGFTLLETTMSIALLSILGVLTITVINSMNAGVAISTTKARAQGGVRDVLVALNAELEQASKQTNSSLNPPLQPLTLLSASSVRFQVPADNLGTSYSQPITYTFVNEDANGNGLLDANEDTNGDGALTRCIMRAQAGVPQRVVGGINDLANVQFSLNAANDVLTITVTSACVANTRRRDLVWATASSSVYLQN
ncbi:MAG TPA: type II secretion system protein [Candidatus Hydrogenedentes bacterium]|nr:type II secretion system protein [Candidatus Hydrogenedentota bacterium]HPC16991.1 type II secretion system protein [Candidatus Hydrogenedentota bacterium]HRT20870.1 type II secretion system protein [Candidatus Hydrogenedentota bacterium]HRT66821.1 type II secretion system protein [Candidatus Hydrogenedentota bacterium]